MYGCAASPSQVIAGLQGNAPAAVFGQRIMFAGDYFAGANIDACITSGDKVSASHAPCCLTRLTPVGAALCCAGSRDGVLCTVLAVVTVVRTSQGYNSDVSLRSVSWIAEFNDPQSAMAHVRGPHPGRDRLSALRATAPHLVAMAKAHEALRIDQP